MKDSRFLVAAMLILSSLRISAEGDILTIWPKEGKAVEYAFSERPRVVYVGNVLRLTTKKTQVDFPVSNLHKFTFDGIGAETVMESIRSQDTESPTHVYTADGKLMKTIHAGNSLSLDGFQRGVYIVKQNKITYKIIKR